MDYSQPLSSLYLLRIGKKRQLLGELMLVDKAIENFYSKNKSAPNSEGQKLYVSSEKTAEAGVETDLITDCCLPSTNNSANIETQTDLTQGLNGTFHQPSSQISESSNILSPVPECKVKKPEFSNRIVKSIYYTRETDLAELIKQALTVELQTSPRNLVNEYLNTPLMKAEITSMKREAEIESRQLDQLSELRKFRLQLLHQAGLKPLK